MIENFEEAITGNSSNSSKEGTNHKNNTRIKVYQDINFIFDNHLRKANYKTKIILHYLLILLPMLIVVLFYYNDPSELPIKSNFEVILSQLHIISMFLINEFRMFWGAKANSLIEVFEMTEAMSFYPIEPMKLDSEIYYIPFDLVVVFWTFTSVMITYYFTLMYQYFAQKILFNGTILNYYIPLILVPNFWRRKERNYICVKLIKHQKQKVFAQNAAKTIVSNLFDVDIDNLTSKDKIEIILKPKRIFQFWDYYELTYTINDINLKKVSDEKIEKERLEKLRLEKIVLDKKKRLKREKNKKVELIQEEIKIVEEIKEVKKEEIETKLHRLNLDDIEL